MCSQRTLKLQFHGLPVKYASTDPPLHKVHCIEICFLQFLCFYIYIEMLLLGQGYVWRFTKDTIPSPRMKEILCAIRHIHYNLKQRGYPDGGSI